MQNYKQLSYMGENSYIAIMEGARMRVTCTRRLEIDAGHRLPNHLGKCKNLHGHRYVFELTAEAEQLDSCGRVIDFSEIKSIVGSWLDENWDHGTVLHVEKDAELANFLAQQGHKLFDLGKSPTAENMAAYLLDYANVLLCGTGIHISKIRVYETPNCYAEATL